MLSDKIFFSRLETAKSAYQIDVAHRLFGMRPVPAHGSYGTRKPAQVCPSRENDMKFRPLHDRILVRRIEAEEKTAGGMDF